ncbi:hypothetical protein CDCA_CDCA04G1262 [Cyanidium caldarium]|uniref:Cytochrome c oxidase subunit n=1 Tax=Cyanidium caldarium TaxID=2771 RepID=A0AAV9ISK7_CYACA|nr:hypothetical protein CDCA_CDCA04G1262 [Cyanidium caldarium]
MSDVVKLETAPRDPRFPSTNQTMTCWVRYLEWKRCQSKDGEDSDECKKLRRWAYAMCPIDWVERWEEQQQDGTFPGPKFE